MASTTISEKLRKQLAALPARPGVYIMRNADGEVIYVGKAARLKDRVRSYFGSPHMLEPKTRALREHTRIVDVPGVESIQTALLAAQATLSPMYSVAREATLPPMYSAAYSATRLVTYSEPQAHFAVLLAASVATASAAVSAAFRTDHLVAQDALAPTVKMLQASALDLLDAMIDPGLAAQENV